MQEDVHVEDEPHLTKEELRYRRPSMRPLWMMTFWVVVVVGGFCIYAFVYEPAKEDREARQRAAERFVQWQQAWDGYEKCVLGPHVDEPNRVYGLQAAFLEQKTPNKSLIQCRAALNKAMGRWTMPSWHDNALIEQINALHGQMKALPPLSKDKPVTLSEESLGGFCQSMQVVAASLKGVSALAENGELAVRNFECGRWFNAQTSVVEPTLPEGLRHIGMTELAWSQDNPEKVWRMEPTTARLDVEARGDWLATRAIDDANGQWVWLRTRDGQKWEQVTAKVPKRDRFWSAFDWQDDGALWVVRRPEFVGDEPPGVLMLKAPGQPWKEVATLPETLRVSHIKHLPKTNEVVVLGSRQTPEAATVAVRIDLDSGQARTRVLVSRFAGDLMVARAHIKPDGAIIAITRWCSKGCWLWASDVPADWSKETPKSMEHYNGSSDEGVFSCVANDRWMALMGGLKIDAETLEQAGALRRHTEPEPWDFYPQSIRCLGQKRFMVYRVRHDEYPKHHFLLQRMEMDGSGRQSLMEASGGEGRHVTVRSGEQAPEVLTIQHDRAFVWSCAPKADRCTVQEALKFEGDGDGWLNLGAVFYQGRLFVEGDRSRWF